MEFSDTHLLMQHMSTSHTVNIENVFEKAQKSCGGPFKAKLLLLKLIYLFAKEVLLVKKLEIEETKTT